MQKTTLTPILAKGNATNVEGCDSPQSKRKSFAPVRVILPSLTLSNGIFDLEAIKNFQLYHSHITCLIFKNLKSQYFTSLISSLSDNATIKSLEIGMYDEEGINPFTPKLEELELLTRTIQTRTNLKNLALCGFDFEQLSLENISKSVKEHKGLSSFGIRDSKLSLGGLDAIGSILNENETLESLELNSCSSPTLPANQQTIYFDSRIFSMGLKNNTTLKYLSLISVQFNDDYTSLTHSLMTNKSIAYLNFNNSFLDSISLKNIAYFLQSNPNLHHLSLENCFTGEDCEEAIEVLADSLALSENIEYLSLSGNDIMDDGIRDLSVGLTANKSLRWLSLCHAEISDEGLESLVVGFKRSSKIEFWEISNFSMRDRGAYLFADLLNTSQTFKGYLMANVAVTKEALGIAMSAHAEKLKYVDLGTCNPLLSETPEHIGFALCENIFVFEYFTYHMTKIPFRMSLLATILKRNHSLKHLDVFVCASFTEKCVQELAEAIAINTNVHTMNIRISFDNIAFENQNRFLSRADLLPQETVRSILHPALFQAKYLTTFMFDHYLFGNVTRKSTTPQSHASPLALENMILQNRKILMDVYSQERYIFEDVFLLNNCDSYLLSNLLSPSDQFIFRPFPYSSLAHFSCIFQTPKQKELKKFIKKVCFHFKFQMIKVLIRIMLNRSQLTRKNTNLTVAMRCVAEKLELEDIYLYFTSSNYFANHITYPNKS